MPQPVWEPQADSRGADDPSPYCDVLGLEPHAVSDLVDGAGLLLLSACSFIHAAAFTRFTCVALQVRLHLLKNASADETPTCSSWEGNGGVGTRKSTRTGTTWWLPRCVC